MLVNGFINIFTKISSEKVKMVHNNPPSPKRKITFFVTLEFSSKFYLIMYGIINLDLCSNETNQYE